MRLPHATRYPPGFTGHLGRLVPAPPIPPRDQPDPFRDVVDALTNGCGCACHTGIGYRSSCYHCSGTQVAYTTLTADDWVLAEPVR
jgi:hypothetical protein